MLTPEQRACVFSRVRALLSRAPLPEERPHAEDVLRRVRRARPHDLALHIAALGHDLERALPGKVRREDFLDYDAFKRAHARRSAERLDRLLRACGVQDCHLLERVAELVRRHETGGTPEADLLCQADALSFFIVNFPHYAARNSDEACLHRLRWGLRRLPPAQRERLARRRFSPARLNGLMRRALESL